MARYRVLSWRGIPSQLEVVDENGDTLMRQLPAFFQQQIDRVAMAEGLIDDDAYLEAWEWSEPAERDGSAAAIADDLVEEVAEGWRRVDRR